MCVVGVAGAGKTTALGVLAAVYADGGVPVLGAAPSGHAADELAAATGIRSATMHRLLLDARRDGGLPRGSVPVVDEAGMAETRVLASLLRLVDEAGGKAILVGDPGQLPAVGAGGLFPALCARLGSLELMQNRRQLDPAERAALARLRAGEPEPYLAHAASSRCGAAHHMRASYGEIQQRERSAGEPPHRLSRSDRPVAPPAKQQRAAPRRRHSRIVPCEGEAHINADGRLSREAEVPLRMDASESLRTKGDQLGRVDGIRLLSCRLGNAPRAG